MGDRTYVQIPGDRMHELPPLLIHAEAACHTTQPQDVMDLAESRVSQIHSVAITKLRAAIQKMQLEEDTFR